MRAQSLQSGAGSLIVLIGKGASGALIAILGIPIMILINGISFLFSAFSEAFIQVKRQENQGSKINFKSILTDLKGCFNYLAKEKHFRKLVISALLANLFSSGFMAMTYPFALEKGFSVSEYGLFMAFMSFAGLVGVISVGIIKIPPKHRHWVMTIGFGYFAQYFSLTQLGVIGTLLSILPLLVIALDPKLKRMICSDEEIESLA